MASKASMFFLFLAVAAILAAAPAEPAPAAPAPAVDCQSILIEKLAGCFSFVTNGSTDKVPDKECCGGLATVLKQNTVCICKLAANPNNNSDAAAFNIDPKRAMMLPEACKTSVPNDKCAKLGVPINTPVGGALTSQAPAGAPTSGGPGGSAGSGSTDGKTAPAPSSGTTSVWSTWSMLIAAGLPALAVSFASF